jgi:uncharacterized protein involved in exopolysaccharide biosynthesis
VIFWLALPPKWQATATIQIGQMPSNTPTEEPAQMVLVEPVAQAAERLSQRELEDKALTALGLPLDEEADKRTALFRKSLKASVVKNTNFLQVSLAAFSTQDAKKYVNAAIQSLIDVHNQRMAPVLKSIHARLEANAVQMTEAQTQRRRLQGVLNGVGHPTSDGHFAPHIVAADLLAKQDEQIRTLTTERTALSDILSPSNTYPTKVIDAVFVPGRPYSPKLSLFLPVGLLLGAAIGVALALLRDRRRNK